MKFKKGDKVKFIFDYCGSSWNDRYSKFHIKNQNKIFTIIDIMDFFKITKDENMFKFGDILEIDYWGDVHDTHKDMAVRLKLKNFKYKYNPNKEKNGGEYSGDFLGPVMRGTIVSYCGEVSIYSNHRYYYCLKLENGMDIIIKDNKQIIRKVAKVFKLPDKLFKL